jgi:hypothetical protein
MCGNIVSPPCSATSISASIAAHQANVSCSRLVSLVMSRLSSHSVRSSLPPGGGTGSSKARSQPLSGICLWCGPLL